MAAIPQVSSEELRTRREHGDSHTPINACSGRFSISNAATVEDIMIPRNEIASIDHRR